MVETVSWLERYLNVLVLAGIFRKMRSGVGVYALFFVHCKVTKKSCSYEAILED